MGSSWLEWLIYSIVALILIVGILHFLRNKMNNEEEVANWERIR
jgi:hypothetical protein